ncbi:MAG: YajD family HNH nuclease [Syntrophales bacterium]|nr:YajD family HNH nuclease [Syntrophales bacterium]
MARTTFSSKGGRVKSTVVIDRKKSSRPVEDVVREIKKGMQKPHGEDYREQSLAIHGLICAWCGREFDNSNRHLLTVHHKDGNHHYNPSDGKNWENLCIYCHENIHSRELLGDYFDGTHSKKESSVVYEYGNDQDVTASGMGILGEKLQKAMKKKAKK